MELLKAFLSKRKITWIFRGEVQLIECWLSALDDVASDVNLANDTFQI